MSNEQKQEIMKAEMIKKLNAAKKGLENAHKYLQQAISKNDAENENYYFAAVWRYTEIVNDLQKKLK